tara:strand:- start:473 stop:2629 length:2157 start_codon:yes stop_codon:yes gene_type:complete
MSKYPFVYILRNDNDNDIDIKLQENKNKLNFSFEIISPKEIYKLNNMFDVNYQILLTYGENETEHINEINNIIVERMRNRWLHKKKFDLNDFNVSINYCYINNVIEKREKTRPQFSIFTTCYNSYEKIHRAYNSIKEQILRDWEWVILDDSPDDKHFDFLREISKKDKRIRLYKRDFNSGNIGNVKNECISLCRGKYLLELDHDDIILPSLLQDTYDIFESDDEIGFVYADFANVYEDWSNFHYGQHFAKGNSCYYLQKYKNKWLYVCCCTGINNITTSHLVCLPNHPRMWRRKTLMDLENYSEFLPICDDFEILMRTMCNTKIAKLDKLGYIQFMNNNSNNFSLIRNGEINRLGPVWIQPLFYTKYNVNDVMKEKNAYVNEKYIYDTTKIWKRKKYEHKICSLKINNDYEKQICLIQYESLFDERIQELYKNKKNDFILLDNRLNNEQLINLLELHNYSRMKCFGLTNDTSVEELETYFHFVCRYTDNYELIKEKNKNKGKNKIKYDIFHNRHDIINHYIDNKKKYLEIGIEYGFTFKNVNIEKKVGCDPDPKIDDDRIIRLTSDDFFKQNNNSFDVIFIDGMHHNDFVLRDLNNSIDCLNKDGIIFIDDVLPITEREQYKIPIKHKYENGILKYKEPWTGDVWKLVYYLLKHKKDFFEYDIFTHSNYRGVVKIKIKEEFKQNLKISPTSQIEIENYNYKKDFTNYVMLLTSTSRKI